MTKHQSSESRKKRQAGHTMMESAFILIPFLALLLGIVDFGMSLFVKSTIQNAVAAGVRYAVTSQTKPGLCMDDSIRVVTQSNAMLVQHYAQCSHHSQLLCDNRSQHATGWGYYSSQFTGECGGSHGQLPMELAYQSEWDDGVAAIFLRTKCHRVFFR